MLEITIPLRSLHPAQQQILTEAKRFNVIKNGRRWGKTELAKELAISHIPGKPLIEGGLVGYWTPTYKDLNEVWGDMKHILVDAITDKNEQLKQITAVGGGRIDFWSMEEPDSGRGFKYHRAIIDEAEKAKKFQEAWTQTIRPTLADYEGDAWILSTPKGKSTFFTELAEQYPAKHDNWMSWQMSTYTNPHIPEKEIELMKAQMDSFEFRQEILAESLERSVMAFAFGFSEKNTGKCSCDSQSEIYLSFDFNKEPLTCLVAQKPEFNKLHCLENIFVNNADIDELCQRVVSSYPNALFLVTGDQTGENTTAIKVGLHYFRQIKENLCLTDGQVRLPGKNPLHRVSRTECNAVLNKCEVIFDSENCKETIWDLKTVEYDPEKKKIVKDERRLAEQRADFLDCFTGDTRIQTDRGESEINRLRLGDSILTRDGYRPIVDAWDSVSEVWEYELDNGRKIKCTKDHKFYVHNIGWLPIFNIFEQGLGLCELNTEESNLPSTPNNHIITAPKLKQEDHEASIGKCGLMHMEKSPKDTQFTTSTTIHQITGSRILKRLREVYTKAITWLSGSKKTLNISKSLQERDKKLQKNGTAHQKEMNGISNTQKTSGLDIKSMAKDIVRYAPKAISQQMSMQDSAQIIASLNGEEDQELITKKEPAFAENDSSVINIMNENIALSPVRIKTAKPIGKMRVYDITVEGEHEFFANGVLAHNCFRYMVHTFMRDELKYLGL